MGGRFRVTWLPASPHPACIPASCLRPWVLPAPALAQAAPTAGLGHLGVGSPWLLSLPATSASGRTLVLPAGRGGAAREPSPFVPPLRVSRGAGLERDRQRAKPLGCLFPTPGVFVQSSQTHGRI